MISRRPNLSVYGNNRFCYVTNTGKANNYPLLALPDISVSSLCKTSSPKNPIQSKIFVTLKTLGLPLQLSFKPDRVSSQDSSSALSSTSTAVLPTAFL